MKEPQTFQKDEPKAPAPARTFAPAAPVADKPDGPKERYGAIHYLINQIRAEKQSGTTLAALDKIVHHLDLLEGKPEAVEAEKVRLAEIETARVEQAKADAAKAKEGV